MWNSKYFCSGLSQVCVTVTCWVFCGRRDRVLKWISLPAPIVFQQFGQNLQSWMTSCEQLRTITFRGVFYIRLGPPWLSRFGERWNFTLVKLLRDFGSFLISPKGICYNLHIILNLMHCIWNLFPSCIWEPQLNLRTIRTQWFSVDSRYWIRSMYANAWVNKTVHNLIWELISTKEQTH